MTIASEPVSHLSIQMPDEIRLEMPIEPVELREWMRQTILAGGDPREDVEEGISLGMVLWERWRSSLEPSGVDRESFFDMVESYGREIWLWIIGERRWEQCIEGLAGRISRRLPPG
ncbi:MAG: hypothetical protein WAM97_18200 [Acidimicrobiales bacterium]|jgi:hypothetical protein